MKRCLALLMACLALTGCAQKPAAQTTAAGPVEIVIWHDKEDAVAGVVAEALKALEPEIHVTLEKKSGLTETLKLVGNDPNAAPDLYFFAHDKLGVYAEMGILAPITDFLPAGALDALVPMTVEAATYRGAVYQLPLYFETTLFMYNRKYMDDSEAPATTEELYAYMQAKTKYGHYGFVEQHSTPYYSAGWIHAFGGSIIDAAGNPQLDSEQTVAALAYHQKFVALMPGETEYATVNTLFREGKAHATINGPWFVPAVREAGIDVGIAPMPVVDETGLALAPYSGVQGMHVLKVASPKKEAITRVLTALLAPEVGAQLAAASACAPAVEACYAMEQVAGDPLVAAMYETAKNAVPMPNMPEMDVMWTVAGNLLADVNMRGMDVRAACEAAQKKALELIEAMR